MTSGTFTNNGFVIAADTELNDRFNHKSSDASNSSQRPKLVIEYTLPQGQAPSNHAAFVNYVIPKAQPLPLLQTGGTYNKQPDGTAGVDTYLLSTSPTANHGTEVALGAGESNNATNRFARALIRFDLSEIPANASIDSATLSLWTTTDLSDNERTIHVYRLKRAFNETEATWNIASTGVNWQTPGASGANDRESADIGSIPILASEPLNTEKQISLSPAQIQEMTSGAFTDNGFIIVADTELNDRFNYKSSDASNGAQRPKLVIQYTIPPTATPTHTPTVTPTASATPVASNTPSPTPTVTQTPPPQGPITITYDYDPLYRLKEANYSTGDYYHYTYDAVGNRKTQNTMLNNLPLTTTYLYDDANRLTSANGVTHTWDNNGNLLNDGANTYTYDSTNRLKTLTGPSISSNYAYNGLGDRLQETTNGNTTTFTMDLNAPLTRALSNGTNTYIYGAGIIAQTQGSATDYFLGDALGSVRQLANNGGVITYARMYDPYGAVAQTTGAAQTSYGYTGEYTSNNLVYLRARYYAPAMGRFFTRDPFSGYPDLPQTLNPYAYGLNNPILHTDPSGETPLAAIFAIGGAVISGGGNLAYQLNRSGGNWNCVDWGQVALWAGGGAVAGLMVGFTLPMLLASPDSFIDLASMGYSLYTGDATGFALDAMSLAIPGFTGAGALRNADEFYDATRYGDNLLSAIPPACYNSFSADTTVVTKNGDTPIHKIRIGDYVLAWDEETNQIDWYKVTDTIHHTDEIVVHLTIDGEEIDTTPEHPFYVEGKGWVNAEGLQVGDDIRKADGSTGEIEEITTEQTSQEMYNLTVDEAHTFFVGDRQWLVHNACPPRYSELENFRNLLGSNAYDVANRVPLNWSTEFSYYSPGNSKINRLWTWQRVPQWKFFDPSGVMNLRIHGPQKPFDQHWVARIGHITDPADGLGLVNVVKGNNDEYWRYYDNNLVPTKDNKAIHIDLNTSWDEMRSVFGLSYGRPRLARPPSGWVYPELIE